MPGDAVDVLVACGLNHGHFADVLVASLEAMSDRPMRYIFGVSSHVKPSSNLERLGEVHVVETPNEYSSQSHGVILNYLISRASSDVALIVDVDVAVLTDRWCELMVEPLCPDVPVAGAEYIARRDRFRYRDWPTATFCTVHVPTVRDELAVDFRVSRDQKAHGYVKRALDRERARLYGYDHPITLAFDTGHELSSKLRAARRRAIVLRAVRSSDPAARFTASLRGIPGSEHSEEYVLGDDLVAAHMRRSSLRGPDDPLFIAWRDSVVRHIAVRS